MCNPLCGILHAGSSAGNSMKILIILTQLTGLAALVPAVVVITLWLDARGEDGPSVIFRGGIFTSGNLYQGPEPDWSFTDDIRLVE